MTNRLKGLGADKKARPATTNALAEADNRTYGSTDKRNSGTKVTRGPQAGPGGSRGSGGQPSKPEKGATGPRDAPRETPTDSRAGLATTGTTPRLSKTRRIPDALYDELRAEATTPEIRDRVNKDRKPEYPDPALPGLTVTKRLHADHVVSMHTITRMEGFERLTRDQQLEVLRNEENFVGLSETANTSKGKKSFFEWTRYKKRGIDVDPEFRKEMVRKEARLRRLLQQQIDDFLTGSDNTSGVPGKRPETEVLSGPLM